MVICPYVNQNEIRFISLNKGNISINYFHCWSLIYRKLCHHLIEEKNKNGVPNYLVPKKEQLSTP